MDFGHAEQNKLIYFDFDSNWFVIFSVDSCKQMDSNCFDCYSRWSQ